MALPYVRTTWANGMPIDPPRMNNIEQGLVDLDALPDLPTPVNGSWLTASGGAAVWRAPNAPNGTVQLDGSGLVPVAQMPYPAPAMVKFADVVLGSAGTFDIQSIPATAIHLMMRLVVRGDTAAVNVATYLRFNNDSSAQYFALYLQNNATTPTAGEDTAAIANGLLGVVSAASAVASYHGDITVNIGDYTAAKTKNWTSLAHSLWAAGTGSHTIRFVGGVWASAAAINRIQVIPAAGSFIAGSRLTLYGLN